MTYPARSELIIDDTWFLAEAEEDGKPVLVRARQNLTPLAGHPEFPRLLSITWRFRSPEPWGFPSEADKVEVHRFEDRLFAALEHDVQAIASAVITHAGTRTWLVYTSDFKESGERIASMPQENDRYPST